MAYITESDLLLGDLLVPSTLNKANFISKAEDELHARVGFTYEVPFTLAAMPTHESALIRLTTARLATGRLVLEVASATQALDLNAYGESLVALAYRDLDALRNGTLTLTGATRRTSQTGTDAGIFNADAGSAVDAFEQFVSGRDGTAFRPGGAWGV